MRWPSSVPESYDDRTIALTFDVEWAHEEIVRDIVSLLDDHGLQGTFFVTHDRVLVPGHERGIHPNFRSDGDVFRSLEANVYRSESDMYREIIERTLAFAPEAVGVRAHSLFFDSRLLPLYRAAGITYDSSQRSELVTGLMPFWKQFDILEIPTYYADYFDIVTGATEFNLKRLALSAPGLKVLDFHPVLVYSNVKTLSDYEAIKPQYHDPEKLRKMRYKKRGIRDLFIEVLDAIASLGTPTSTMSQLSEMWRNET